MSYTQTYVVGCIFALLVSCWYQLGKSDYLLRQSPKTQKRWGVKIWTLHNGKLCAELSFANRVKAWLNLMYGLLLLLLLLAAFYAKYERVVHDGWFAPPPVSGHLA